MVVHDGEAADIDREDPGECLQSFFNPAFAVFEPVTAEERASDAAGDAVVEGRHARVDQQLASHRHGTPRAGEDRNLNTQTMHTYSHSGVHSVKSSFRKMPVL